MGEISNWFTPFKTPFYFLTEPEPLVCLAGLNYEANHVHRCIWEMINLKNPNKEFQPIYINTSIDYTFPPKKPKVENIENYNPHGIIKSSWCSKHLNNIPSVVVAFFDMNWSDPHWNDKKIECANRVKDLKTNLPATQVLLMLIKSSSIGDDNFSTERASALCAAAEIPPKSLFVLSHTNNERIQACIQRLETGMKDLSKNYYISRLRRIKSYLDKTINIPLIVRYNFKLGFFLEIKKDFQLATSHYQAAMEALINLKVNDYTIQEIKVVASLLNYRICKLFLARQEGKEAKSYFEKHIQSFYNLKGNSKLIFEHLAWLEEEHFHFAELLKKKFKQSSHHPDPIIYYLKAVKYAQERKKFFETYILTKKNIWPIELNEFKGEINLRYIGQRPWRTNVFTFDNSTLHVEENEISIEALYYLESLINHSDRIINILGIAQEFCRSSERMRTRCQLMSMMGIEHFEAKEYSKCLLYLSMVLREFGKEKWNKIIYHVADVGIKAAGSEGDIPRYLNFLLFLLKLDMEEYVSKERRGLLWSKFTTVLDGRLPLAEEGCEMNKSNWEKKLEEPFISYIDIHNECILDCQIHFAQENVRVYNTAQVRLLFKNLHEYPITIRKYGIKFNLSDYNSEESCNNVTLRHNENCILELLLKPYARDISKILRIQVAHVDIGTENRTVLLHYSLLVSHNPYLWSNSHKKELTNQSTLKIEPAKPLLKIKVIQNNPALYNEWHKLKIFWFNSDTVKYTRLYINVAVTILNPQNGILTENVSDEVLPGILSKTKEFESIGPGEDIETVFLIKIMDSNEKEAKLNLKAKYIDGNGQVMTLEQTVQIEIVTPFQIAQSTTDLTGLLLENICVYEDFCLNISIKNSAFCNLKLDSCRLIIKDQNLNFSKINDFNLSNGVVLKNSEQFTLIYFLNGNTSENNSLGLLEVKWKRDEDEDGFLTKTEISLAPLSFIEIPLYLKGFFDLNGPAKVKTPLIASYRIKNRSNSVFNLSVSMDSTENFMNAGPKKLSIKLGAKDFTEFSYILFPLVTGLVSTPKINIEVLSSLELNANITTLIHKEIPSVIFITPTHSSHN